MSSANRLFVFGTGCLYKLFVFDTVCLYKLMISVSFYLVLICKLTFDIRWSQGFP